jgi:subtilase-type serine protease
MNCMLRTSAALVALALASSAAQAEGVAGARGGAAGAAHAAAAASVAAGQRSPASGAPHLADGLRGLDGARRRTDGALVISGTLSGNGTVPGTGTRVILGKVAPGNSPGCVTDQGNVVFEGSSTLEIEIAGAAPCTGYDQYTVAQSLTLNGPKLNVLLLNGYVPAANQRFKVLSWGSLNGRFATVNLPALPAGLSWDQASLYTTGELVVAGPAEARGDVPLPAWALGLLGAGLALSLRRPLRRRGAG